MKRSIIGCLVAFGWASSVVAVPYTLPSGPDVNLSQLQTLTDYSTVCETGSPCDMPAGNYQLVVFDAMWDPSVSIVTVGGSSSSIYGAEPITCSVGAVEYATIIPADDIADGNITDGQKPVYDELGVRGDAGYWGDSYVVFNVPRFRSPVLFGKLTLRVRYASETQAENPGFDVLLNDVSDVALIRQPMWNFAEWESARLDLRTGRNYGNFFVRSSPLDDGRVIIIPLSYDAIYDVNQAARGIGFFGIGISRGELGFNDSEADSLSFGSLDSGVIATLEVELAPNLFGYHFDPCNAH